MELEKAVEIAEEVRKSLEDVCNRIEIAGSIRRRKKDVGDAELLCIPRDRDITDSLDRRVQELMFKGILAYRLNKLGHKVYGAKNKLMLHVASGFGIDIFSTTEECWPVAMVVRTGGTETNLMIATAALQKGYKFHAYGAGFTTPHGEIVCHSESEVFKAVDLPYREPWERN
jgi:DNA polymerase/3'-5' exonuclease PolX